MAEQPAVPFVLVPVVAADGAALANLRVEAMRDSLERIGRFDPERARRRLLDVFDPARTRAIESGGERIGLVVVKPTGDGLLDHLYLRPAWQGRGTGAAVLARVIAEADAAGLPLRVTALRGSAANAFYQRHGFVQVDASEFDIHYHRPAPAGRCG